MSLSLSGKLRKTSGKKAARAVRNEGLMPAVLYGQKDCLNLAVNPKKLAKIIKQKGKNIVIDLAIQDDSIPNRKVLLKEFQTHPLRETWVHVDFLEVDMNKLFTANVPIKLIGVAPGEKKGGTLNHVMRELELECLPDDIPETIEISIAELDLEQAIHVSDVKVSDKIKILNPPTSTIVVIHVEKIEEEKPAEGEEEVPVEGAEAKPADEGEKTEQKER